MSDVPVPDPALVRVITSTGPVYHLSDECNIAAGIKYRNKRIMTAAEAANSGLIPCHVCRPPRGPFSNLTFERILALCNQLRRILDKIDSDVPMEPSESLDRRVERLASSGAVPQHVAACIKTITAMRRVAESNRKMLSSVESKAVDAIWDVLTEWAINSGLTSD
jgi:hypothetical protein